jgi:molybdopterin-containing oxidoreductase family iron-sulfur binding subunit
VENPNRSFYVLEQLHVLPNVTYLAKVRNAEEGEGHHAEKAEGAHAEKAEAKKA